jgi:aspartyl-tRNA(Asn)/glutamyl-tRNA(Gln) amidotransferase subunit A
MDEFAMGNSNRTSYFGNVRNPYDPERVSGGSSGGGAAAVAADLCSYSIGTDTGGSIRQPAAHCGVTGIKPTCGRISRNGVVAFAGSFDTVGAMANSAEDCGVIMEALCGGDFTSKIDSGVKGLKIALIKELLTDSVETHVKSAVMGAAERLREQGAEVSEVSLPILDYAAPAYFTLASAEAVSALSRFDGMKYGLRGEGATYEEQLCDSRTRGFGKEVKRRIMLGNFVLSGENMETYFRKALAIKQQTAHDFDEIFTKADVIISPTSMRTAFNLDEPSDFVKIYSSTLYTVPMNLAGLPCISTPCNQPVGFSKENMPIGLSVTGKKFDEATILQVARCIEEGRAAL